ncbi:transporter [Parafilimonas terrae]|uniref:Putative MetA-pathway of phenol degradation n=1 Tax=Parafilimonas terrae TaxID=1465490 RepID=A0A1I5TJE9_9BACT|nr:transporter [Parafilimonas terrae]SFP82496.1 Putative MetA-pathway of phenol degradation [Parafilimonas terrae]
MPKYIWLGIIILLLSYINVFSQERIAADRPDQTETAALVPKSYFQGEFGFGKITLHDNDYTLVYPTALLKYGLTQNFELRLEGNLITEYKQLIPQPKTTSGLEPLQIGFKTALFEGKSIIPKTSLITHFALPFLATKEFKAQHIAPSFVLVMDNDITKTTDIGYNFGAAWDGFSTTPEWGYTISFGFDITKKFSGYTEAFGLFKKDEPAKHSIDGGLCYYVSNDVKLDTYAGFGVSKHADDNFFGIGISFRFK